ncbi:MAG: hypothetical protein SO434_06135, partial [Eubacteriales bacterium]|nr:hypothetical protein [Eubacteriales bacterium]
MGNCKSKTIILIVAILCFVVLGIALAFCINDTEAYAMQVEMLDNGIKHFKDILPSLRVENIDYLYNFDDSIDYIFIDFVGSNGYAILVEETLEILEYSLSGNLPYTRTNESKYYGGPQIYFTKKENMFKNILNNETFEISDNIMQSIAEKIRQSFSIHRKSTAENLELLNNRAIRLQAVVQTLNLNNQKNLSSVNISTYNTSPPIDPNNPISPTNGAQYIDNSEYFITPGAYPKHGENNGSSCVTVASQLLLSYNNYYNDRRIIADNYLFGDEITNPENNPNYCRNPEKITSETIGSNQDFHDMLLNNYGIVSKYISATTGLESYLEDRNIDYEIKRIEKSSGSLDQNEVISELNAGRPIILGTTSDLNGVLNFNHAVVAYGYQSFAAYENDGDDTIYTGYITNFGWDPNGTDDYVQVWANASWFKASICLTINHTHEYSETTLICECGHRKSTYQKREVFSDFGYEGSTYSWKGSVEMSYDLNNQINPDEMLIVKDQSTLYFEVKTISSENAWLVTNGEIRFELEQSDGQIIQTNICTVTVDLLNNVTFTGNTFSIDTSQLGTGTYFLKMYCTFNRGEWSSETTHSYVFGVNRPITVMEDFGYLSSWYKWKGNVKLSSDHLYLFNNSNSLTLMG